MRSTKLFIKDGLMLTVTALLLRSAGVFFSARLSILAGKSVMGLYTQIMSVYSFAVTVASAGINLGATRIISECCGSGNGDKTDSALRTCLSYCLKSGLLSAAVMFFFAPFFGNVLLRDARTVVSLRALSAALPFIALSGAFHGYFNGVKQISKSAFTSLFEQFVRIGSTIAALNAFQNADSETLCLILVICNASSEALSFVTLGIFYLISRKDTGLQKKEKGYLKPRFLGITVPIAASALIRSALTTAEHILIPIGLRANGLDSESALAEYGIVSGMVLPILLYPMALLSSFASVTVAELAGRVSAGEGEDGIRRTVTKGLSFAIIYGIGCSAIIGALSSRLGYAVYKSAEAGGFIRMLAPLVFFMYLDHISDGMLKGLNKQNYVMKVNIIDASLSVLFAALLIPKLGIYGFIISLYACECLNCIFSFGRIFCLIRPEITVFSSFVMPAGCAFVSCAFSLLLAKNEPPLIILCLLTVLFYILLLLITGSLDIFKRATRSVHMRCKA